MTWKFLLPIVLVITLLMLLVQGATFAGGVTERKAIKSIMATNVFTTNGDYGASANFCPLFLKDFQTQYGIAYAEPMVHTDDYDDPTLRPYTECCPKLRLNERLECIPAFIGLPPDKKERLCEAYYGTAGFKLYHVDIDNSKANGREYLFYFEKAYGPLNIKPGDPRYPPNMIYANGEYKVIDFKQCKVATGVSTHDPYDYYRHRPLNNHNGIINYNGQFYIFDLFELVGKGADPDHPDYFFTLYHYDKQAMRPLCSFSTIAPRRH